MDFKRVVEVEEVLHLVVGDAAIDHRLLAGVDDDERQLRAEKKLRSASETDFWIWNLKPKNKNKTCGDT